jgi:hypothetical protein
MKTAEKLKICIEALEELTLGRGAYDMDRMTHAENTIRDMTELAKETLKTINYYGTN